MIRLIEIPQRKRTKQLLVRMKPRLEKVTRRLLNWPKMLRIEPLATMSLVSWTPLLTLKLDNCFIPRQSERQTELLLYDLFVINFWLFLGAFCVCND